MIGSILNEGVKGLQTSQREITRASNDIARANVRPEAVNPATDSNVPTTLKPVVEGAETGRSGGIAEPLIELRRQEQLFTASAKVITTADKTLGALLDIKA